MRHLARVVGDGSVCMSLKMFRIQHAGSVNRAMRTARIFCSKH